MSIDEAVADIESRCVEVIDTVLPYKTPEGVPYFEIAGTGIKKEGEQLAALFSREADAVAAWHAAAVIYVQSVREPRRLYWRVRPQYEVANFKEVDHPFVMVMGAVYSRLAVVSCPQ